MIGDTRTKASRSSKPFDFSDRTRQFVYPCSGLKAVVVVIGIVDEAASDEVSVGISVVEPMFGCVVSSEVNCSVLGLVCLEV